MNENLAQFTQGNVAAHAFHLLTPQLALLAITCAGLFIIVGGRRLGLRLLLLGMLLPGAILVSWEAPFASTLELVRQLPSWAQLFLLMMITLGLLRFLLMPFLGRDAAAGAVSILAAESINFIFRMAFLPLRFIQRWMQHR